jgi:hypothetical protein
MEEWRPINDYPNYLISSLGRVKIIKNDKIRKPFSDKDGYLKLNLSKDGIKKAFSIHRLVGIHFLPNWNNYPEIDHVNRNPNDNRVINLRWCNRRMNALNTKKRINTTSKYKNVCFVVKINKWRAMRSGKVNKRHLGYFETEEEAYLATQI